jgi:hypothetical protein
MIESILLWLMTSLPVLVLTGAVAAFGIGGWALGLFTGLTAIAARLGGIAALCAMTFILGFRVADDRAAHQAQVATLKADNARLTRDLGAQKTIAEIASQEREGVLQQLEDRNRKVADYEARLANEKPHVAQACNLTAADIRALRGLRAKQR